MFTRRILPLALLSALTIAGSTAGAAIAANSQGSPSTVRTAHPTHSITAQLDRYIGPEITRVSPDSGPTTGGTTVTITGADFTPVIEVAFGAVPASYTIVSSTEIIATSPAESAGTVTVQMRDVAGWTPYPGDDGEFTYS
jgi:large repetitive protein